MASPAVKLLQGDKPHIEGLCAAFGLEQFSFQQKQESTRKALRDFKWELQGLELNSRQ